MSVTLLNTVITGGETVAQATNQGADVAGQTVAPSGLGFFATLPGIIARASI